MAARKAALSAFTVPRMTWFFSPRCIPAPEGHLQLEGNQLMRNMVLKNQVILGTVNADKAAFLAAIRDLGEFKKRWPQALEKVISARHPVENFRELLTGKATGIKNVIAFAK